MGRYYEYVQSAATALAKKDDEKDEKDDEIIIMKDDDEESEQISKPFYMMDVNLLSQQFHVELLDPYNKMMESKEQDVNVPQYDPWDSRNKGKNIQIVGD